MFLLICKWHLVSFFTDLVNFREKLLRSKVSTKIFPAFLYNIFLWEVKSTFSAAYPLSLPRKVLPKSFRSWEVSSVIFKKFILNLAARIWLWWSFTVHTLFWSPKFDPKRNPENNSIEDYLLTWGWSISTDFLYLTMFTSVSMGDEAVVDSFLISKRTEWINQITKNYTRVTKKNKE